MASKAEDWSERSGSRSHALPSSGSRLQLFPAALLLFGILARLVGFLQNPSLIGDEAMLALNIGRRSFAELLQPLDYSQVATVPFLWAERLMTQVGGVTGYALRVVPLLAGIGLLGVLYRLTRNLLGDLEALVALALAVTSFPLIRYSVEVKPYIVDALVCALLICIAVWLVDNLDDRRRWAWLGVEGAIAVLVSTPALLVCAAMAVGLAIAGLRRHRLQVLPWLLLLGVLSVGMFGATYIAWYAPVADSPYMRHYWEPAFLKPGTPHLLDRLWFAASETACTLTCWRGALDLTPVLLLLAAAGTVHIWRRRGPEYAVLIGGPLMIAFCASALGRYPIATRLVLFSAPLLCIMVAAGLVSAASLVERLAPRVRARWVLLFFLYPSFVVAVTLTFFPPIDWGIRSVEVRPLADDFQLRGQGEPVYVFVRSVPTWVFHTTDWDSPDTTRLKFAEWAAGPDGPGFINASSKGRRKRGEGESLVYRHEGSVELYGTPTGSQSRAMIGHVPQMPDPGWAESEAWRIRKAARPFIWIVLSDFVHGKTDERQFLMEAVKQAGGQVVYTRSTPDAVLYRVRFPLEGSD